MTTRRMGEERAEQSNVDGAATYATYAREKVAGRIVPAFFRGRLVAIVGLAVLIGTYAAWREPAWKTLALAALTALGLFFFVYELRAYSQRRRITPTLAANLVVMGLMQMSVIYLTGGIQSPLLPFVFPFLILANAFFPHEWLGLFISALYVIGVAAVSLLEYAGIVPSAAPAFLQATGSLSARPYDFWLTVCIYLAAIMSVTGLGRVLVQLLVVHLTELAQTRAALLESMRRRTSELETIGSQLAHELKNPLTSIKALVQLLQRSPERRSDNEVQRLAVIGAEIGRLEAVLAELANFTRPLEGVTLYPVRLSDIIAGVEGLFEARLTESGVTVQHRYDDSADVPVHADARKLTQVLVNLVENALAAMPSGGTLAISLRLEGEETLELAMTDSGSGMSTAELQRAFDPFYTTKATGTGLGLTIARAIVEQHAGTLRLESTRGIGTRAIVRLPLAPAASGTAVAGTAAAAGTAGTAA